MLGAAIAEFDFGAHALKQLALGFDVADLGNIFEDDFVLGKDGGGHAGKRGVFGSGDLDRAEKRVAAADYKLVHQASLRGMRVERVAEMDARVKGIWVVWFYGDRG